MTATLARIYYAYPDPAEWSYIGQEGALALVFDKGKGIFYFRMIDVKVSPARSDVTVELSGDLCELVDGDES